MTAKILQHLPTPIRRMIIIIRKACHDPDLDGVIPTVFRQVWVEKAKKIVRNVKIGPRILLLSAFNGSKQSNYRRLVKSRHQEFSFSVSRSRRKNCASLYSDYVREAFCGRQFDAAVLRHELAISALSELLNGSNDPRLFSLALEGDDPHEVLQLYKERRDERGISVCYKGHTGRLRYLDTILVLAHSATTLPSHWAIAGPNVVKTDLMGFECKKFVGINVIPDVSKPLAEYGGKSDFFLVNPQLFRSERQKIFEVAGKVRYWSVKGLSTVAVQQIPEVGTGLAENFIEQARPQVGWVIGHDNMLQSAAYTILSVLKSKVTVMGCDFYSADTLYANTSHYSAGKSLDKLYANQVLHHDFLSNFLFMKMLWRLGLVEEHGSSTALRRLSVVEYGERISQNFKEARLPWTKNDETY